VAQLIRDDGQNRGQDPTLGKGGYICGLKKYFPVTVKGNYVTWFLQGCQGSSRVTHVLIH
jgi:hypothetical protein